MANQRDKKKKKRILWILAILGAIAILILLLWFWICPCLGFGGAGAADDVSNGDEYGGGRIEESYVPPYEEPPVEEEPPAEEEPLITECDSICTTAGYDFGILSDVLCKPPFSENIGVDSGTCCCGNFGDFPAGYHIEVEGDWCFDSDLDEFDHYSYPGFCVDSSPLEGIWDTCVEPMDDSTDIREAICMGVDCIYSETTCAIEGGTDDCFDGTWGDYCASF